MRAHKYDAPRKVIGSLPEGKNERSYKLKVFAAAIKILFVKESVNAQVLVNFVDHLINVFPVNVLTEKRAIAMDDNQIGTEGKRSCLSWNEAA